MKRPIFLALGVFIILLGIQGFYIAKYTFRPTHFFPSAASAEKVETAETPKKSSTFAPTVITTYSLITIGACVTVWTITAGSK